MDGHRRVRSVVTGGVSRFVNRYGVKLHKRGITMKCSSASEWKVGDKGKIETGQIVTIERIIGNRYLVIEQARFNRLEDVEKDVFIPAHGEIEKVL